MSCEGYKMIVRNMPLEDLLDAICERVDLPEVVNKFRYHEDFAPREYLTIEELQGYLKCGRNTALEIARYGLATNEYHVNQLGRKYLVDRLSYERYVSRKTRLKGVL